MSTNSASPVAAASAVGLVTNLVFTEGHPELLGASWRLRTTPSGLSV